MSSIINNGDWQSVAFRQKVILNIDDALKKSGNLMGSQNEKSAGEIEKHIFDKSTSRDTYMTMVARIILALQSGGQNQPQSVPTMSQGPMTPMMPDPNMQQSGQVMVQDQNALRSDAGHLLPKMLTQPSPMSSMSTPSPKIPLYHSPSPASVQQVKQPKMSGVRPVQVNSNTAYPSPSPIIPSPSPAGHSPAQASSPAQISAQSPSSLLASRISGIPSVESPGSFNPPSNLGLQESPVKTDLSDKEEQLYVEKLKQLSVYTEPLRKMIAKMQSEEDVANKDSKNLTKLKRLLSILGNPKERVPYQALLKVEDVLRRKLPFEDRTIDDSKDRKHCNQPAPIGHSLLEALQGQGKSSSPRSNNRLFHMLAPTLGTIHGPPICPPQVPSPRREHQEPESTLPHAVKSEIAQLTSHFTVDYASDESAGCEQTALVCSINDKTLPAVPDLVVRLPADYPSDSSPYFDTKDYETSDFLKRIKERLKNKLASLPRMYTFTALLLNWESAVRYVHARSRKTMSENT